MRLHDGSLRLRLSQPEVRAIAVGEQVKSGVTFPGGERLDYSLQQGLTENLTVRSVGPEVVVILPHLLATRWANSDEVAIEATLDVPGGILRVLVEKDFTCLHPRPGETEEATFPNPNAPRL